MSEQDMVSDSMVERAARASYAKMTEIVAITRPGGDFIAWDALPEEQRRIMLASQRAAIAAMREPTEEMIDAADGAFPDDMDESVRQSWRDVYAIHWQSMIDKALESK